MVTVAEPDPDRLDGASCAATLDAAAGTLTFDHRGWGATAEQKARSPVVVPLGAIAAVEYKRGRFSGWFRVMPRGVPHRNRGAATDPHGLVCAADPTEFAERVKAAMATAPPAEYAFLDEDDLPAPTTASRWRSRLIKGTARALVDGFFNTR
jgi:hypothetical protein